MADSITVRISRTGVFHGKNFIYIEGGLYSVQRADRTEDVQVAEFMRSGGHVAHAFCLASTVASVSRIRV